MAQYNAKQARRVKCGPKTASIPRQLRYDIRAVAARCVQGQAFILQVRGKQRIEMAYQHIKVPADGDKITLGAGHKLDVPDRPIIPFIEGDGTGRDIWRASQYVFDNAVKKIYGGKKKIAWMEVYAGEKSFNQFNTWLPDETTEAFKEFLVGIKGPLTTPVGGGIRSLN